MSAATLIHIDAADMSGDITPVTPLGVHHSPWAALHMVWTGTPTGTFVVEVCNDWRSDNAGTWEDISSLLSLPAASGSAGSHLESLTNVTFAFMRVRYLSASGSGRLTVTAQIKGV